MATKKFLTSVADVYAYDENDNVVFTGKTLLDSSIEVSLGSAPVRGGKGNQLQYIYYHTGEMKFTLTDVQWNLGMLAATVGETLATGDKFYDEESVTLSGSNAGTVSATPLAFTGTTIYGWATSPLGVTQRVTFTGTAFNVTGTEAVEGSAWCVRYYTNNLTSGQYIKIDANMIPKVVKLVMETQLNSADVTTNKIGIVQVIAPKVVLSGAFTISMKADGVSNTPLTGTALAYTPTTGTDACTNDPYYATIVEIIDATYWYSNVIALAIEGGDYTVKTGGSATLSVWAIPDTGAAFKALNSQLTFTSSASYVTVGANTGISYGAGVAGTSASIVVYITSSSSIEATAEAKVIA